MRDDRAKELREIFAHTRGTAIEAHVRLSASPPRLQARGAGPARRRRERPEQRFARVFAPGIACFPGRCLDATEHTTMAKSPPPPMPAPQAGAPRRPILTLARPPAAPSLARTPPPGGGKPGTKPPVSGKAPAKPQTAKAQKPAKAPPPAKKARRTPQEAAAFQAEMQRQAQEALADRLRVACSSRRFSDLQRAPRGAHRSSSSPLPFSRRASTNRKSDSRLR